MFKQRKITTSSHTYTSQGKSVLLHWIISQIYDRFQEATLLSDTADLQPEVFHFIPKERRHVGWQEQVLDDIMKEAMEERKKLEESFPEGMSNEQREKEREDKLKKRLVILDDIICHPEVRNSAVFKAYFTTGRHFKISVVILSQNCSARESLSISARGNMDYSFATKMTNLDDTIRLARYYYGGEGWKKGVARINQLTTEPFSFAVSDMANTMNSGLLVETTYTIKAPPLEEHDDKFMIEDKDMKKNPLSTVANDEKIKDSLKDGIARLVQLQSAVGPPLLMVLPGRSLEAELNEKDIRLLDHGLRPADAKKRKFSKHEDEHNDAAEVLEPDDLDEKSRKTARLPWSDVTLTWDGDKPRF